MKYEFRKFEQKDYDRVCNFLMEISQDSREHINWNWARWEWMYFHPEFDRSILDKVGLWFAGQELVGMAAYDGYLGDGFFPVKRGFEELEKDVIEYSVQNFSGANGLGIAVNDNDERMRRLLEGYGFSADGQAETILAFSLEQLDEASELPEGIRLENLNAGMDLIRYQELLWRGFDHEGEGEMPSDADTIEKQRIMLSAPHMNPDLHVIAKTEDSEYVSYCGLWYDTNTDYAYVEPVCTIPGYRKKGIGGAVVTEALKRAKALGAKTAYVISDMNFYKDLGFARHSHYPVYWYKNK